MSRFTNPVPQFFLEDGSVASFGRMYFYENNNFATLKSTFSRPDNTVENSNPVKLTGSGRLPSCFGEGLYSVKFYSANPENPDEDGTLIWTRNDVSLSELAGQFELWNAAETYSINDIAKDPADGNYYQLYGAPTSKGEQPSTSLTKWELVYFLTGFNPNKTYSENQIVVDGGFIYRSLEDNNEDAPPSAKWANLTFNDSVAGDFSVGGDLTVSGDIITESERIALNGGFNAGSFVVCERVGKTVTITSVGILSHPSATTRLSTGFLPSRYLTSQSSDLSFGYARFGFIIKIDITPSGTIRVSYYDYAGTAVSRTDTEGPFSLSYTIIDETP